MTSGLEFLRTAMPTLPQLLVGLPASVTLASGYLAVAARLKRKHGWRTGYTRKVFHLLVFLTVAFLQARWGVAAVCLFGAGVSLVVFHAVLRGAGWPGYEALAREQDAPHRTYFVLAPYAATLLGGLGSNLLFGSAALAGYLVAGAGDAIGEPVGTRWGRHRYRVPAPGGVMAERSLEGSAAVFAVSFAALALALVLLDVAPGPQLVRLAVIALLSTAAEAVSPHGWDNATLQLLPSALVYAWGLA